MVGTMIRMIRNPAIAQIAKHAGLDFIMFDMEHGPHSLESLSDVFGMARSVGLDGFVRVPELAKGYVSRALDAGATGIMVPMLETVEQARQLVEWGKFDPIGKRGFGSAGGHTGFGPAAGTTQEFMDRANGETLLIAQIETRMAVEQVEEIAAVKGIDALLIGPNDLAISLGVAGDLMGDVLDKAVGKVIEAAKKNGKVFGMHAPDALMERWIPKGQNLIMSNLDISMLAAAMKAISAKYAVK